jgi:hypothetical protein
MQHAGQYVRGPGLNFDLQHPTVYAEVLAEVAAKHQAMGEPPAIPVPASPQLTLEVAP